MAYSGNNLSLLVETMAGQFNVWLYKSADTFATVKAADYITDAQNRGLQVGDLIAVADTTTPALTLAMIVTVGAAGATMSQTGAVPST